MDMGSVVMREGYKKPSNAMRENHVHAEYDPFRSWQLTECLMIDAEE